MTATVADRPRTASQAPADAAGTSATRKRAGTTLLVALVALSLRLLVCAFAMEHFGAAWFYNRGTEVGFVAQSLVTGHGFASPFGPPTGPTALIAPGYPWLTAAVFRCAGSFTGSSAWALMTMNVLANVAGVLLVLALARRVASERAAVLAALIPACAPPLLWMPTIFWETSFSGCASARLHCLRLIPRRREQPGALDGRGRDVQCSHVDQPGAAADVNRHWRPCRLAGAKTLCSRAGVGRARLCRGLPPMAGAQCARAAHLHSHPQHGRL